VSRRQRALALLAIAGLLGALAAADVSRREARVRRELGPLVPVVVLTRDLPAGARLPAAALAIRRVPARYAPAGALASPREARGLRTAVAIPAGADLAASALADGAAAAGAPVAPGERVAQVDALGPAELIAPGGRVDVLVTREARAGAPGDTVLALQDVEVLAVAPAGDGPGADGPGRLTAALRVTVRQAVYLAAAQSFARELRLLPRAGGDRRRSPPGVRIGAGLG